MSSMLTRFCGIIITITAKDCFDTDAVVRYLPSSNSLYHSEIHGSMTVPLLSKSQRLFLARRAKIVN